MITTLAIVGTTTTLSFIVQYFLNQLIAEDIESLKKFQSRLVDNLSQF